MTLPKPPRRPSAWPPPRARWAAPSRTRQAGPHQPLYDIAHAAERIRAAAEAAHALPFPFTLTARAENFLVGRADLGDTIRRLQAYQAAGADVLYAPGLATQKTSPRSYGPSTGP